MRLNLLPYYRRNYRRMLIGLLVPAALVGGLVLAGCGGGGDSDEPEATATSEASETPTEDASAAGDTVTIDEAFWHAGWKVTLEDATFDPSDSSVSINATFENQGADTATFDSDLVLTVGTQNSYTESTLDQELPEVPGELSGNGVITFRADDSFTFDDAALVVGGPDVNQARVPVGTGGGDFVTLEPRTVPINGTVTAGAVTLNLTEAEMRFDLPDWHRELEKGKLAMTIPFSATVGAGIPIGQGVLQSPNVALKLPDGTAVAVISDGRSGVNELLQGKEGTTISDLSVRFEVDEPPEGQYGFVLRGVYAPGNQEVEGELAFTVEAATPAGAGGTPTP